MKEIAKGRPYQNNNILFPNYDQTGLTFWKMYLRMISDMWTTAEIPDKRKCGYPPQREECYKATYLDLNIS
jgi:hypothetical protein